MKTFTPGEYRRLPVDIPKDEREVGDIWLFEGMVPRRDQPLEHGDVVFYVILRDSVHIDRATIHREEKVKY